MTISAGGARAHPGTTVDALLHTAEVALAAAKRTSSELPSVQDARRESAADESGEAVRVAATLARAAAVREGVPNEHECSVAELAELVGRELGLPESCRATSVSQGCCTTSARSPSPARCSRSPGRWTSTSG